MNELALFAGAGGGILGGKLLGWRTVCAVEYEPHAIAILIQRQNDGILQPFPIWDDVRTFDGKPWKGIVDVVSGGFPCQDISAAGSKKGIAGERSGLWGEMARIIGEVRPPIAFVENSPMLTARGLGRVLGDLAEMGYNAKWGVISAENAGALHKRERIWILAHSNQDSCVGMQRTLASEKTKIQKRGQQLQPRAKVRNGAWRLSEPSVGRVVNGVASRMDKLRVQRLGNGQVPAVVRLAWKILGPDSTK